VGAYAPTHLYLGPPLPPEPSFPKIASSPPHRCGRRWPSACLQLPLLLLPCRSCSCFAPFLRFHLLRQVCASACHLQIWSKGAADLLPLGSATSALLLLGSGLVHSRPPTAVRTDIFVVILRPGSWGVQCLWALKVEMVFWVKARRWWRLRASQSSLEASRKNPLSCLRWAVGAIQERVKTQL
jgi:hypothetical protein